MRVRSNRRVPFVLLGLLGLLAFLPWGCARKGPLSDVVIARDATWHERVAAAEIRRYLYLRTGSLPVLREVGSFARVPDGAVAVAVKRGLADAGMGVLSAALALGFAPGAPSLKTIRAAVLAPPIRIASPK